MREEQTGITSPKKYILDGQSVRKANHVRERMKKVTVEKKLPKKNVLSVDALTD